VGRNRSFDEDDVVARAGARFLATGYEATSVDDLVGVTGLHRGSIYRAFGSKRGLFLAVLRQVDANDELTPRRIDTVLVALLELAPVDDEVREITRRIIARFPQGDAAAALGARLMDRAGIAVQPPTTRRTTS